MYWKSNIFSKQHVIFDYKSSNSQQNILLIFTLCSISLPENTRTYCILDSFWTHRWHTKTAFSHRRKHFPSVKGIREQAPVPYAKRTAFTKCAPHRLFPSHTCTFSLLDRRHLLEDNKGTCSRKKISKGI